MCTAPSQTGPNLPAPPPASAAGQPWSARASDQQPPMAPTQAPATGSPASAASGGTAVSPPARPEVAPKIAPSDSAQTGAAPKPAEGGDMTAPAFTDFKSTHFGNADDPNLDKETAAGRGAFGPLVDGKSLALSDTTAEKLGAKPGDEIELEDAEGKTRVGTYDDRVPAKDPKTGEPLKGNRIDIYDPRGSEKKGTPFNAIRARRLKTAAETLYVKG